MCCERKIATASRSYKGGLPSIEESLSKSTILYVRQSEFGGVVLAGKVTKASRIVGPFFRAYRGTNGNVSIQGSFQSLSQAIGQL